MYKQLTYTELQTTSSTKPTIKIHSRKEPKAQSDHQITYRYKDQGAATYYTVPHLLQSFYQSRPDPPESPKERA